MERKPFFVVAEKGTLYYQINKIIGMTSFEITECPICHIPLNENCRECQGSGEPRVCQGLIYNAACAHPFHTECIKRWLEMRFSCPLCNTTWIFPQGLSLSELCAAKFVDNENKIVELVNLELDDRIYKVLSLGGIKTGSPSWWKKPIKSLEKKKLLAFTFAHYLNVGDLERLVASKKKGW